MCTCVINFSSQRPWDVYIHHNGKYQQPLKSECPYISQTMGFFQKKSDREITTEIHLHVKLRIFSESNGQNASYLELPLVILHFALIIHKT